MSGITQLIENAVVPLVLQLVDGATDQYPQCEIRDNDDNLLRTVDLIHAGSGLYTQDPLDLPDPYIMPDEVFIAITYIVYSDAGHTTVNTEYYFDVDVFILTENTDWGTTEREQIRGALGIDGTKTTPTGGQLQSMSELITRALGLMQENFYIDNTTYTDNLLTNARIRIYSDPASVGTGADVIATYEIVATYSDVDMQTYKVVKT